MLLPNGDFADEAGGPSGESRRWSQREDALTAKKQADSSVDETGKCPIMKKDSPQIGNLANLTESEISRPEHQGPTTTHRYCTSKSMLVKGTLHRGSLDVKRVNDFLRLLINNHQRTVKHLA